MGYPRWWPRCDSCIHNSPPDATCRIWMAPRFFGVVVPAVVGAQTPELGSGPHRDRTLPWSASSVADLTCHSEWQNRMQALMFVDRMPEDSPAKNAKKDVRRYFPEKKFAINANSFARNDVRHMTEQVAGSMVEQMPHYMSERIS